MKLPRAQRGEYGQEYCGAIYSRGEGIYYSSKPSPLGETQLSVQSKRKTCRPPRYVLDDRGTPSPIADFHSHPWSPSAMSEIDRLADTQRWLIRIQFDTSCHIQKLIHNRDSPRPGELYERRGRSWKLVGYIMPENKETGWITPVEENP
ncbi:hypothetical protein [Archangium sp.]|uniref:hypothetical protein n=1 Tax=Archangium sp. TaxID=1872627 RepID=UPI002D39CCF4|nr:hypothetical protein [Archangium sp.]HYO53152.1 hypothetical protein [Archangium sp.]